MDDIKGELVVGLVDRLDGLIMGAVVVYLILERVHQKVEFLFLHDDELIAVFLHLGPHLLYGLPLLPDVLDVGGVVLVLLAGLFFHCCRPFHL